MKKITIPSKLRATISKLDIIVSVGIALTCIGALIIGTVQFKNSLTNVNSNIEALDALPCKPLYATERDVQTYDNKEITDIWKRRYAGKGSPMTIAEMSARFYMQPHDPSTLADLVVIGTYTGQRKYRYRSFVADVRIDKVLSPLGGTSKLMAGTENRKNTYKIPSLNLHEGNIIKVYDKFMLTTTDSGDRVIAKGPGRDPYSHCFTPLRPNGQYLFFLNYSPKVDNVSIDAARFKLVPSLYGRIPISNEKTFEPNIFCANLPTKESTENNAVKPLGANSSDTSGEDFNRRYEEARAKIPKFTYRDTIKFDLFVKSPKVEQLYRDTAAKILRKYL